MAALALCFGLVLARTAAFVAALPVLGGRSVPRMVKAGLALALAYGWFESLFATLPARELLDRPVQSSWLALGLALAGEAVLGAVLGFAFGLVLVPARVAGEFLSQETGLGFGNLLDPAGGTPSGPLPQLFELLGILLVLGLDLHHLFLAVAYSTFAQYPVGGGLPEVPVRHLVAGAASAQEWGLLLAMPVALCLFLTTVALALLTRTAPQLNLYSIGFPLRLIAGLAATLLLLPNVTAGMLRSVGQLARLVQGLG